ncbi:MAG: PQQ-binding-like beta-propeller repeat protein [Candidatus Melainabacteria bacterium]|nr:PQQ-binding-like beta-propeller repeat protein [Candidatus Melainabacteria bacterium]
MTAIFAHNDKLEDGHYTVLKELGVGGMGVVYHCRDEFLQREVAIKMLLPELMADSKNVEVFTEEARLAARMEHPNIVTVYDIGVESRGGYEHHFVAMEYLPGGNLAVRTQGAALNVEHALNWMKQLANGLYFAHRKGVVHQDVKADNIFITVEGDLKIGDFGLARLMANKVYINPSTKGMGTPAYMSPELCRGEQQDQRSDIYSLGVLFFEMVTGQLPYRANGMIEMAMKHTTAPIPSVRRLNPEVPDVLDRLIRRMMEKTPGERYQSLNEVLKILDDLIFDLRVARMGLTTKRTSQKVETGHAFSEELIKQSLLKDKQKPGLDGKPEREKYVAPPVVREPTTQTGSHSRVPKAQLDLQADVDLTAKPHVQPSKLYTPQSKVGDAKTPVDRTPAADGKSTSPKSESKTETRPPQPKPFEPKSEDGQAAPQPETKNTRSHGQFDDRAYISYTKIEAAGIKMLEPVGPAREPTQKVVPVEKSPRISAYSIPVVEGLNPLLTEQWVFKTNGPVGWNSSPVCPHDDNAVYIASTDGALYKIGKDDGELIWRYDSGSMLLASPIVRGNDVLLASSEGAVIKLDSKSGEQVWRTTMPNGVVSMPAISGNGLIVPSMTGRVSHFDIRDGGKLWDVDLKAPIVCNPTIYGDVVFLATRAGDIHSLQLKNGKERWQANLDGPIVSTPATSADSMYVGTQAGTFYSLDIESGQSMWEHQVNRGIISGAVIIFTSVIFCGQDKWLYSCEKYDGRLRWKSAVKGTVQSALSGAAQSVIAVSREGWMQGFESETGHMKWQKNFGCRLESQPLVLKNGLLVASVEGELTCYAFGAGQLKKSA